MDKLVETDNLASLPTLDEHQLLEATKARFNADKIYTYIGDILVAVNPYKEIPQYGPEDQQRYYKLIRRDQEAPHIYALADSVYQSLQHTGLNQCCVVSGESGAGKTESTKYIVKHIALLCNHDSSDLHERIVTVNPLLEAFGNAQTIINNNSSRFGKYIQLDFDDSGSISGAHISEYLLEKSRVVSLAHGEKNFHIFYYMFAGLPDELLKANRLERPDEHRIMRPVDGSPVFKAAEDKTHYREMWDNLQALFKVTGFKEEDEQGILATLAGILHLTDIEFVQDDTATDDSVIIKNEESLLLAAELLMVKSEDLARSLISNSAVLQHSAEQLISMKNVEQANDGRDALAKALYGRMFSWTVRQVNFLLKADGRRKVIAKNSIGILDLAGFENFQNNSFEQLCINVANEQLHNFFNQHIFQWEMEEYRREGIQGKDIKFADNTDLLDMFIKPKTGFFALLDDQLKIPAPSDLKLLDHCTSSYKGNASFQRPRGQDLKFVIHHYAGPVIYNVNNFLEKNRDTLSNNLTNCMKNSESNFIVQMFYCPTDNRGSMVIKYTPQVVKNRTSVLLSKTPKSISTKMGAGSRISRSAANMARTMPPAGTIGRKSGADRAGNTMGFHFINSLTHLMSKLRAGEPHFIRCIKPNTDKLAEVFQDSLVLQQLRYTGVLETVKIRRQGYATRLPFELFLERYKMLSRTELTGAEDDKCRQILSNTDIKDYEIGKTKVFLRYWHTEQLQERVERVHIMVTKCQAFVRRFLAQRKLQRMMEQVRQEAQQVREFCDQVTRMFDDIYKVQLRHHEEDKERHRLIIEKREAERKKREKEEADERIRKEKEDKDKADRIRKEKEDKDKAERMRKEKEVPQEVVPPPPDSIPGGGPVSAAGRFIMEELMDSVDRFQMLSNQIWAKVFYMEKRDLMGKVYLRDWDVMINNSNAKYNGRVIGLKYEEFCREDGKEDEECLIIKDQIVQGVEIGRDEEGSILMRNLSESPLIAKDYINPGATCIAAELIESFGQIPKWFVKVFDMAKYKYHVAQELHKPQIDIQLLQMLSVVRFAFIKNTVDDFSTPCWVFLVNFCALELLGNEAALDGLLKMGKTAMAPERRQDIKRQWAELHRSRRESTDSWRSSMTSQVGSPGSHMEPMSPTGTIGYSNRNNPSHKN